MSYKIFHLPSGTYMYYNMLDSVMFTEYEVSQSSNKDKFSNLFDTLELVGHYIDMGLNISKLNGSYNPEFEFELGTKSNILFCHFEIQEVKHGL
jgi:hypothetical protein